MKLWFVTGVVVCAVLSLAAGEVGMSQIMSKNVAVQENTARLSVAGKQFCPVYFKLAGETFSPDLAVVFEAKVSSTDPKTVLAVRLRFGKKWTYSRFDAPKEWKTLTLPFRQIRFESGFGGKMPSAGTPVEILHIYARSSVDADMTLEVRNIRIVEQQAEFADPARGQRDFGRRPAEGAILRSNPAIFVWKEQPGALSYTVEYARDAAFTREKTTLNVKLNAYCGDNPMAPGVWYWRVRNNYKEGASRWSKVNRFEITGDAQEMCMPSMAELLKRIPVKHPRLYLRPEQVGEFKKLSSGTLKAEFDAMIASCDKIVKSPGATWEPGPYDGKRGTPQWTASWRKNYGHANLVSFRMAQTAFGWLMTGNEQYLAESKRLLKAVLSWDPQGYSRMQYNDEAGMPILRYLARTYTFLYDALTPEERAECVRIMRIRGNEAYRILCPRRLYEPFESHSNRMYYFLGEAGIAFHDVIPEAKDWLEYAVLYFFCNYPIWGDDDGNWHEGPHYWAGYMGTFTDWADVMQNILKLSPLVKPYFKNVGYFLMYEELPGAVGYGWGDFSEVYTGAKGLNMMKVFASQSGNAHWQWYVDQISGGKETVGSGLPYVAMLRKMYPVVKGKAPTDIPASRLFRGNGIAVMNTSLLSAADAVQIQLKCGSQFGNYSHGFESANTFLLNAFGERLLIRSGTRDCYGSKYHRDYMWDTQSQNNILVNGRGQIKRQCKKTGNMLDFSTTPELDRAVGEAADCYADGILKTYRREILFRKPSAILIIDRIAAKEPVKLDFLLHGRKAFAIQDQHRISQTVGKAACTINFLWPAKLHVSQTDKTDPPIIDPVVLRRKATDHHLTATPEGLVDKACFITLIRPYKAGSAVPADGKITETMDGFTVSVPMEDGKNWVVNIRE